MSALMDEHRHACELLGVKENATGDEIEKTYRHRSVVPAGGSRVRLGLAIGAVAVVSVGVFLTVRLRRKSDIRPQDGRIHGFTRGEYSLLVRHHGEEVTVISFLGFNFDCFTGKLRGDLYEGIETSIEPGYDPCQDQIRLSYSASGETLTYEYVENGTITSWDRVDIDPDVPFVWPHDTLSPASKTPRQLVDQCERS